MIDPEEGCSKCKQFQQNALDAYAIIKRMSTQKNRSASDMAEVASLKKLNDEQSQYILNQRKIIERISKEKDELDSSNKHLKIKNEEMNSQYNDLILSLGEVRKKVGETLTELSETRKKYAEVLKKEESFRKSMEQFVLCKKMLMSTFSIIKQIKAGQIGDDAYDTIGLSSKSKKKVTNTKNNKDKKKEEKKEKKIESVKEPDDGEISDNDLERIMLAEMDISSSEEEEDEEEKNEEQKKYERKNEEESSTKPNIDIMEVVDEKKEENQQVTRRITRNSVSKKTNTSNRAQNKKNDVQKQLPPIEKVINKPTKATNTITGRKTKSVKEQISEMDMAKIKEKYKSDMEKMKKNVEAIKKTKK
ncbi:Hypothetical protein SRAE_2000373400 [Strongyloides ratti]|uniref:Uncharacterized protein n=1 Tax=Strongyloides ratti TaxID=34506 RepID=A0A090LH24_STRRB|nr:Hypothetical protein SRAE_2000373400 [Strongyloides ratti]CEF69082.1 Hypothetical protein SRAE_2000373400 [Strongyloides ratti]